MSDRLPTREEALQFLKQNGCKQNVIRHSKTVSELATEIAVAAMERGHAVDVELIEIGALLHDIGRGKTHSVHHSVVGAEIAQSLHLPRKVVSIIKRHVGGGITATDARKLGWPKDVYIPQTVEEKIVCYADKLVDGSRRVPVERTIDRLAQDLPAAAIERIWRLHEEILALVGDCDCLP